jgi:hypothetical protein
MICKTILIILKYKKQTKPSLIYIFGVYAERFVASTILHQQQFADKLFDEIRFYFFCFLQILSFMVRKINIGITFFNVEDTISNHFLYHLVSKETYIAM